MDSPMRLVKVIFSLSLLLPNIFFIKLPFQKFRTEISNASVLMVPGPQKITLNQAIQQVMDGGVIEVSPGIYQEFLEIKNSSKNFVIRSTNGDVFLEPPFGGNKGILYLKNNSGLIIFEGLTFRYGYSSIDGHGGAATIDNAKATFIDCDFSENIGEQPSAGGGALFVTNNSKIYIYSSSFKGNKNKNYGGAIALVNSSNGWIINTEFIENKTNINNHRSIASGGAIHIGDSKVRVADSVFKSNEAGFAGGAIYSIGRWDFPMTDVIIVNSRFESNKASKANNVNTPSPNEGGAIHTEDRAKTTIYYSYFISNQAEIGGAISLYRADTEVNTSIFESNQASSSYFGGSISATSNDTSSDGNINRPSAKLTIKDSLFRGNGQNIVAKDAGAVYIAGDTNRMYGNNNVSKMGTLDDNRAFLNIENTAFLELSSNYNSNGHGGAVMIDLAKFQVNNSLFFGNSSSNGGAISIIQSSLGEITSSKFIKNKSYVYGGAVYGSGSIINISDNIFSNNELGTVGANPNVSYGASLFIAVMDERYLDAVGNVKSNVFSKNDGLPIYDRDNINYPINQVTYNYNQFYTDTFQDYSVYTNSNPNYCCNNVSKLNELTIVRNNNIPSTKKGSSNTLLNSPYVYGLIRQYPPLIRSGQSFVFPRVVFGWGGANGYLNDQSVEGKWGIITATPQQEYILRVGDKSYSVNINAIGAPSLKLYKYLNPPRLEWSISNIQDSDLLDMDIDMVDNILIGLSGQLSLNSVYEELEYRLFAITKYGGYVIENEKSPILFAPRNFLLLFEIDDQNKIGYIPVYNVGGGILSCQVSSNSRDILIGMTEIAFEKIANIQIIVQQIINRDFEVPIRISCGNGGDGDILLRVLVVDRVFTSFLPSISK